MQMSRLASIGYCAHISVPKNSQASHVQGGIRREASPGGGPRTDPSTAYIEEVVAQVKLT